MNSVEETLAPEGLRASFKSISKIRIKITTRLRQVQGSNLGLVKRPSETALGPGWPLPGRDYLRLQDAQETRQRSGNFKAPGKMVASDMWPLV